MAKTPPTPALRAPLLIVVEAKKNDIEEGLGQCAAQMIAARLFNEKHKEHAGPASTGASPRARPGNSYGSETGSSRVDSDRYYISQISTILGILKSLLSDPEIPDPA